MVADAYGLAPGRGVLVDAIARNVARGVEFLQRRIDRGEEAFIAMRDRMGGMARYDRRRAWLEAQRERFLDSVG